jgi:CheY-like chemotaxis protein
MIVECPQCRKRYRLDESYAERGDLNIKCPNCQFKFPVSTGRVEEEEPPVAREETPDHGEVTAPPTGKKILVADDSQFFRSMVGDILSKEGFKVSFAEDGEEALNMVHSQDPDLLILDLHLPKITGFDVLKEIRRGKVKRDIPILVLSSVYTESSHMMALDSLGANDFIDKKFKPEFLVKKVRKILGI